MATVQDDRAWVIQQYQYLFGRAPTAPELDARVASLQSGMTREHFMSIVETWDPEQAVIAAYRDTLGRDPSPEDVKVLADEFRAGRSTRASLRSWLAGTSEGQIRAATPIDPEAEPTREEENARDYITGVLNSYGLGSLGEWAWGQIQNGSSPERVLQDLRETTEYKQRFVGLEQRRAAGLNAISEAEYLRYETDAQQLFRAVGLPASFYDDPADFADFIGKNVSYNELVQRVNNGFAEASRAPTEVRAELQRLYGIDESQLAAYFLDPDRALPLIESSWQAAQNAGAAVQAGYGQITKAQAERLGALGIDERQAAQGFATLADASQLFADLPGVGGPGISTDEQQAAVFANDSKARRKIDKAAGARRSQGSGASAFGVGQDGISALGADN